MGFLRKKIRLPAAHYVGPRWYFVTLCCAERRRIFGSPKIAGWLIENLRRESALHHFAVHAYCAMPDHFHALVRGMEATSNLLVFLKSLKQETAHEFQ